MKGRPAPIPGVLVVDKPRGPTSHDVVARMRRALGTREIGHAGTLDPMATGVLVIAVGVATKLVPYLTAAEKEYEATIAFGVETDSLDADGQIAREMVVPDDALSALGASRFGGLIEDALAVERARREQVPPVVSAIKIDGTRAHALVRRGEAPELAARPVRVISLAATSAGLTPTPWLAVRVATSKGFYVRALARDLAASLGTVAHLTALRRVRSGAFSIEEAVPIDAPREALDARFVPLVDAALRCLPRVALTADGVVNARHGRALAAEQMMGDAAVSAPAAWVDDAGALVAIGARDEGGTGRVLRGFQGAG